MTDDGQNENTTTHTVTLGNSLSLGNHRGESMARYRGHVSYLERIKKLKLETCRECGCRIRNDKGICLECAAQHFIAVNQEMWQGVNPSEYLEDARQ